MSELTPFRCPKCNQPLGFTNGSAFGVPAASGELIKIQAIKTHENPKGELKITCDCGYFRIWTPPEQKCIDKHCKKQVN